MPIEVLLGGASAFFALLLLAVICAKHYPKVMVMAAPAKHPCGFVPNL